MKSRKPMGHRKLKVRINVLLFFNFMGFGQKKWENISLTFSKTVRIQNQRRSTDTPSAPISAHLCLCLAGSLSRGSLSGGLCLGGSLTKGFLSRRGKGSLSRGRGSPSRAAADPAAG